VPSLRFDSQLQCNSSPSLSIRRVTSISLARMFVVHRIHSVTSFSTIRLPSAPKSPALPSSLPTSTKDRYVMGRCFKCIAIMSLKDLRIEICTKTIQPVAHLPSHRKPTPRFSHNQLHLSIRIRRMPIGARPSRITRLSGEDIWTYLELSCRHHVPSYVCEELDVSWPGKVCLRKFHETATEI
jgi:hypothetical protein